MMDDLPKLEPLSLRPECEPGYEQESWKPTWNCYCCQDTGFVLDRLSSQIIPGFSSSLHKTLLCNASGCNASRDKVSLTLIEQGNFDTRLSGEVCDFLDQMEKKSWAEYRFHQHQLRRTRLLGSPQELDMSVKKTLGLIEEVSSLQNFRLAKRSITEDKQA